MENNMLKQIVFEAVQRFGVMEMHGECNEFDFKKISEWIDRKYPNINESKVCWNCGNASHSEEPNDLNCI